MKTFSVLASLARAANPWLSKATCPCKNTLQYCGCVTQPPRPYPHRCPHSVSRVYRTSEPLNFLRPMAIATVSVFLDAFCDVPINCVSSIFRCLWVSCGCSNAGVVLFIAQRTGMCSLEL